MDFLRTLQHLVEENDTSIAATQQAIMRVDFLLSRTFQKEAIPSESMSQELTLLFQERRWFADYFTSTPSQTMVSTQHFRRFLQGGCHSLILWVRFCLLSWLPVRTRRKSAQRKTSSYSKPLCYWCKPASSNAESSNRVAANLTHTIFFACR